jgi:hypothetical protein
MLETFTYFPNVYAEAYGLCFDLKMIITYLWFKTVNHRIQIILNSGGKISSNFLKIHAVFNVITIDVHFRLL